MAKQIIIATHSELAEGFKNALSFFVGDENNIHTICAFTRDLEPENVINEFLTKLPKEDKVIVFTDIVGGSVNQLFSKKLIDNDFILISGLNLSLLLEIYLVPEEELNYKKIIEIIEKSKNEIKFINMEYFDTLERIDKLPINNDDNDFFD